MTGQSEIGEGVAPPRKRAKKGSGKMEKSRQCPICHVYYKYGNSYWQHVRYVHARVLSQCVICEKSYKRTTMVKHHILHAHKIAWHLCSNYVRKIKKSDLKDKQDLKSSVEKKNNLNYFKKKTLHLISCFNCYYCPGSYKTITELFQHVRTHRYNFRHDGTDSDSEKVNSSHRGINSKYENIDSYYEEADFS